MTYLLARYWPHILIVVFYTAFVGVLGHAVGEWQGDRRANKAELALAHVQRDAAQQVAMSEAKAREAERKAVERMFEIEALQAAERERIASEVESRTADLVAGNLRLRREIAAYATRDLSRDASTTRELEASAQRGAALIAAAIGVGAEADAVQRGLIEAYEVCRMNGVEE